MSLDDGYGGECRVCYAYHLGTDDTVCTECIIDSLFEAINQLTKIDALKIIKENLLKGINPQYFSDELKEKLSGIEKYLKEQK